jgi:2,3-bisphosphoglycerate-independent phosphoglycerate mutase
MSSKVVLIVMDGWGDAAPSASNAISVAQTPFVKSLVKKYPHGHLLTSGEDVGLPAGQMGNSEVGHLNLGAGRVVYQELALINKAIREKTIDDNQVLKATLDYCLKFDKPLHFFGLVSNGGVHSHTDHLIHLCRVAHSFGLRKIYIHAFTDGRDTDPRSGLDFISQLDEAVRDTGARIATVVGRYYAMDRDKRWERVKLAYDLLVKGEGKRFEKAADAVADSYRHGVTDEFIKPCIITQNGAPVATIQEGDAVISFNFRTDRCREITEVLTQRDMPDLGMKKLKLQYVTMTNYDQSFKDVSVIYEKDNLSKTLGEVIASAGKTQLRIAETEKYPHVTFFFSGGREATFPGEERIMIPSPKVATYDLKPSMSADEVKDALVKEIVKEKFDFICLNFANPDMVGHTGVFPAVVEALETVDRCVEDVVNAGLKHGYQFIITADHGNADLMVNADGSPNTAHTTNPVPCYFVSKVDQRFELKDGRLADIAPTVLFLMELEIPKEMTGNVLVVKEAIR